MRLFDQEKMFRNVTKDCEEQIRSRNRKENEFFGAVSTQARYMRIRDKGIELAKGGNAFRFLEVYTEQLRDLKRRVDTIEFMMLFNGVFCLVCNALEMILLGSGDVYNVYIPIFKGVGICLAVAIALLWLCWITAYFVKRGFERKIIYLYACVWASEIILSEIKLSEEQEEILDAAEEAYVS